MHRARDRSVVPFDPEIKRTLSKRRIASPSLEFSSSSEEEFEEELSMGEQPRVAWKELGIPGAYKFESGIAPPTTPANDFEIRPAMVALIERRQYSGAKNERRALEWLDKEVKPNSLRTWDEVTKEFLSRFYPQKKTAEASALIQGFKQRPNESLYEAWERYKEYQRECPHHGIQTYQVIKIFYGGLTLQGKSCLDRGARGPIMNRKEEEMVDIIEDVVKYYRDWQDGERDSTSKSGSSVYYIDHLNAINNLSSQMTNLGKEMTAIKAKLESSSSCQASNLPSQFKGRECGDNFDNNESEHVNYVSNNNVQRTNLEEIIENQTKLLNTYMAVSDKKLNDMMAYNKMLENLISQLSNALKDQASPSSLPSQGLNPKKPVNVIVTRSGKVLEERLPRRSEDKEVPKEALVGNEGDRASLDEVVF
ncbi:uncharacterized protein LOC110693713 [Chenopodium quinoa]|uniref:uncharacterized protein LOC110693713 n=1 Tax=Chenopodium quinoa TaxID=63459 RepID=UPI000B78C486|nr:uncharacterized protein LOC110693713 [Chenopodium quinoa]